MLYEVITEAIRTSRFYDYEKNGIQVVPSAKAANFTMNRKAIRDLAAKDFVITSYSIHYTKLSWTTKRRRGGTGLGLAIAAQVARDHGGTLSLEESSGPGAEFRLVLPLAPPSAVPVKESWCPP